MSLFHVGTRALYWGLLIVSYLAGFVFAYRQLRYWGLFSLLPGAPGGATALVLAWLALGGLMAQPWQQLTLVLGRWVELWTWRGSEAVTMDWPTVWGNAPSWVYALFNTLLLVGVYGWVFWRMSGVLDALSPRFSFINTWNQMPVVDWLASTLTVAALVYGVMNWLQQAILYPPLRPKALSSEFAGYVVGWVVVVAVFGLLVRFLRGYGCRVEPHKELER